MPVYLLTGKLGSGKSLAAVGRAAEYVEQGRRVVANFHLDMRPLARLASSPYARAAVEVLPDRPSAGDLRDLGRGGPSEEKAGLLILDECATWLNARTWAGKEREAVIDWFLHSRKLGWDVILICQHASALDKQVRELICEYLVTCRRLDRFKVPIIGAKLPRVHVASVRYGLSPNDLNAEHWVYRGTRFYDCYSTLWVSAAERRDGWSKTMGGALSAASWHTVLPAWHVDFRHRRVQPSLATRLLSSSLWPLGVLVAAFCAIPAALLARPAGRGRRVRPARFVPSTWCGETRTAGA